MKVLVLACMLGVAVCAPQQYAPVERAQHSLREEEIYDPPQPYQFALAVSDDPSTNYQDRVESQDDNGVVQGRYSWVAPNGIRYTTTYQATPEGGFQANTKEEQTDIQIVFPVPHPQEEQAGYRGSNAKF